jgi:hypothetical protein
MIFRGIGARSPRNVIRAGNYNASWRSAQSESSPFIAGKRKHRLGWLWDSNWRGDSGSCFHLGMFRAIGMAAGFLFGGELHHFDAGPIRVVRVQAVFAIAADLRAIEVSQAVEAQLSRRIVNVFHAE